MGMPITVFLIGLTLVVTYLMFPRFVEDYCTVVKNFDPKQWFFSMFPHENKEHFIFQIISFIWKLMLLERSIANRSFASMVLKLFLITEGMVVMAVEGWLLWEAGHIYPLCFGFIWRLLFGMYGFLPPTYKNWIKLVIASIFTDELAVIYFLYPVLLFSGPVYGALSGFLSFYAPQSLINYWNRERNIVAYPTQLIEAQENTIRDDLVWRCQLCSYENGVFLDSCDHCGGPREGGLESMLTRAMSPLDLVGFTEAPNSHRTDLVWNCVSCSFENGVYFDACERCGTQRF